ncbi:MAG: LolA family protein [Bacteroidia bacterium]
MKFINIFVLTTLIICSNFEIFAQDAKAKAILDELSNKTKAYTSIKATFSYTLENKDQKIKETQEGTITIKGNKYKLEIAKQEVICDGKAVYTIIKEAKEVQINNMPDPNNTESINPSNIFTMYEKGFKYKFEGEKSEGGKTMQIISLFPNDPKGKQYHTVKLFIDKNAKQISKILVLAKDGNNYTYQVKSFQPNIAVQDNVFTYNSNQYPKFEVIDLRD